MQWINFVEVSTAVRRQQSAGLAVDMRASEATVATERQSNFASNAVGLCHDVRLARTSYLDSFQSLVLARR